ncbi:hypothetical protein [Streptomyces sp. NPDC054771]
MKRKHHRPTFMNSIGELGGKICGAQAVVLATGIDFYYTRRRRNSVTPTWNPRQNQEW